MRRRWTLMVAFVLAAASSVNAQQWATNGNNISNTNSGFVGIGTTNPQSVLHVFRASNPNFQISDSSTAQFRFLKPIASEGDFTYNSFFTGTAFHLDNTAIDGKDFAFSEAGFYFWTFTAGTNPRPARLDLVINAQGNVGVGILSPTQRLHVAGNGLITGDLIVSGNIAAKYQDVAEWVASAENLEAGAVVVLDPDHSNHVKASTRRYDTAVAGVVSSRPGLLLGEPGPGRVKVATSGRVRVKVDARRKPIRIGDLMVTSDTPGVAMRSETVDVGGVRIHRPGTVLGKALEPLPAGTGEILILLSLQ